MKIYTKEEWAREQYKGRWEASPFNLGQVEAGELPAYYIGRRNVMVGGENGPTLLTEGVHFLVDGEYDQLPVLHKDIAMKGACYQFAGGYIKVHQVVRITEEYAQEHLLYYLDHVLYTHYTKSGTTYGGCALPGSDEFKDLKI